MSLLSQFFPSGGGGAALGGGSIPVNIFMVGGGGAGGWGTGGPGGGCGGTGGYGLTILTNNYFLEPGVTYPITIGAGGAGCNTNPSYPQRGANGGVSCFSNPKGVLIAQGGGGGGSSGYQPQAFRYPGVPGGNGGGGAGGQPGCPNGGNGGEGQGFETACKPLLVGGTQSTPTGCWFVGGVVGGTDATFKTGWGSCGGFPGGKGANGAGGGGGNGQSSGSATFFSCPSPTLVCGSTIQCYGARGIADYTFCCYIGAGGAASLCGSTSPTLNGCAGGLIISWPAAIGAAPSSPGATDVTPSTPGFFTYCFTSSGSITLP